MTKIFLVKGSSGAYSDREEWTVLDRAFLDRNKAENLLNSCIQWCAERGILNGKGTNFVDQKIDKSTCPDPDLWCDYNGVSYWLEQMSLED
jgi:hypothetical protein